jgi:predicted DNA-binding transcriptional regulator AlpA
MDLLTQHEAADATRLSERTLERHRLTGTGPKFVRLGRRVFYRRQDVEAWIIDCTRQSTSEKPTLQKCG